MALRPRELRRQVLWLQAATLAVLVAVVCTTFALVRPAPRALLGLGCLMAGIAITGNALVSWRVRRATRGIGTQALARMLDFYEGVLHAAREGLVLVDAGGRVQLVNDEASRLLGLRAPEPGTLVADLGLPDTLAELLTDGRTAHDELHLGALGVVVVNQIPAHTGDVVVGRIVTLRDHTQLQALLGELDAVRSLASSLQAQTHEAANRLHTVVSLIEIGRPDRARAFAVSELQVAQALTDRVLGTVGDPVLSSLLLAKVAQAQERGVLLDLDLGDRPLHTRLPAQDVVTVVGNLLDNAIEAAHAGPEPRRVALVAGAGRGSVDLAVTNTGEGLDDERLARMFERGWTTKSEPGHGLGLALVRDTVRRWQGGLIVDPDAELDGVPALTVRVRLPEAVAAGA
ncbi:MAG TPA: ATP-binding protein [Kribbellaceae bacterium]|nr:ATP-binding protein [Kribbellaceae bacterium]